MLKVEAAACLVIPLLLLTATPTVADVTRDLGRCQIEAERLYPAPDNKGIENWPERESNLEKRAENTETCMRVATAEVSRRSLARSFRWGQPLRFHLGMDEVANMNPDRKEDWEQGNDADDQNRQTESDS